LRLKSGYDHGKRERRDGGTGQKPAGGLGLNPLTQHPGKEPRAQRDGPTSNRTQSCRTPVTEDCPDGPKTTKTSAESVSIIGYEISDLSLWPFQWYHIDGPYLSASDVAKQSSASFYLFSRAINQPEVVAAENFAPAANARGEPSLKTPTLHNSILYVI